MSQKLSSITRICNHLVLQSQLLPILSLISQFIKGLLFRIPIIWHILKRFNSLDNFIKHKPLISEEYVTYHDSHCIDLIWNFMPMGHIWVDLIRRPIFVDLVSHL